MVIKNIHEKLLESIQVMLIDTKVNLPFYGNFNLFVNFHESENIPTCGVNMTPKGMNFYYSSKFLENLSQKEVNFITLHEDFHLLWDHPKRTITGQYDQKLSNIAQDMIINHIIVEDIPSNFIEIPKDEKGRNMALFVPKEYTGKLIFEELYEWLRDEKNKRQKQKEQNKCSNCNGTGKDQQKQDQSGNQKGDQQKGNQQGGDQSQGQDQGQGEGQGDQGQGGNGGQEQKDCPSCGGSGQKDGKGKGNQGNDYGPYGKNPKDDKGAIDTYSLDSILDNLEKNEGQYLDVHMGDEIPEEMRESMMKDAIDRLKSRGFSSGNVEKTLNKLRKKRKDYLKEIKRAVSNTIFGSIKEKTIVRPNRRQIAGVKGSRKVKTKINVILDTSGSMGGQGTFERVLSYVYRNDIEINFMESDTQIKWVENIKSAKKLESLPVRGLGGTIMQVGIDYVVEHFNQYNTVLLTDGYTDSLDLTKLKGKLLIISVGTKVPIARTNGKVKQIVLENND
jgi:predicted metal-dependent peptidase